MNNIRSGLAAIVIVALMALPAPAAIINGNFESPGLAGAGPAYVQLDLSNYGWHEVEDVGPNSSTGIIRPTIAGETPMPTGGSQNVAFLQLANEFQAAAAIWQPLTMAMSANTIYTVNYDVGNRLVPFNSARDSDSLFRAIFTVGTTGANLPYYVYGSMGFKALAPGATANTYQIGYIPDGQWMNGQSIVLDTTTHPELIGQQLNVSFRLDRPYLAGDILTTRQVSEVYLDNVTTSSLPSNLLPQNSLPEPSSIVLLAGSALGMLLWRRKSIIGWATASKK